jgi:hypothetical protein
MLEALEERRAIEVRHARFNAALVTSALCNANRAADSEAVTPFDFLAGFERDPDEMEAEKRRRSTKQAIAAAFVEMAGQPKEKILAERARMVESMTANGVEDADGLIREVFPEM